MICWRLKSWREADSANGAAAAKNFTKRREGGREVRGLGRLANRPDLVCRTERPFGD